MRLPLALFVMNCLPFVIHAQDGSFICPVTTRSELRASGGNYGNEFIATALSKDGKVIFRPGGSGFVSKDGSLAMKFPWWVGAKGSLIITGRRLDAPSSPLRSEIPEGYENPGFQASALIFSAPGCWEVTARVGEHLLTFTTEVIKLQAR